MEEQNNKERILIEEKATSYEMLTEGITLPVQGAKLVVKANQWQPENTPWNITLYLQGKPYAATLHAYGEPEGGNLYNYTIRYRTNKPLTRQLKKLFSHSYALLHEARVPARVKKIINVPAEQQEHYRLYYHRGENAFFLEKVLPGDTAKTTPKERPFDMRGLEAFRNTGLVFSEELLCRYALCLLTKPFVVLSGLSGSGKTRLAITFAKWLSRDREQVKVIAVGADWNTREYLLGYPNALDSGKYIRPENGVLDFICRALENPDLPYFLILDEMNLSYAERYFADFLSAMESGEPIYLHPQTGEWSGCKVPGSFHLPANLYITGTINVDETTYMFSPKILDRAQVIEFRINETEMEAFLTGYGQARPEQIYYHGADMGRAFVALSKARYPEGNPDFKAVFLSLFRHLKPAGAEFGYRTASEAFRFIALAGQLLPEWDKDRLTDMVIMQKLLPKLHGSRKKLEPILTALWELCLLPGNEKTGMENEPEVTGDRFRYPLSATKIRQMYLNAKDNGFTSYAEA